MSSWRLPRGVRPDRSSGRGRLEHIPRGSSNFAPRGGVESGSTCSGRCCRTHRRAESAASRWWVGERMGRGRTLPGRRKPSPVGPAGPETEESSCNSPILAVGGVLPSFWRRAGRRRLPRLPGRLAAHEWDVRHRSGCVGTAWPCVGAALAGDLSSSDGPARRVGGRQRGRPCVGGRTDCKPAVSAWAPVHLRS